MQLSMYMESQSVILHWWHSKDMCLLRHRC